ncbi:MAG TPA: NAD(P)/FAD-dependent oxidoreductase [Polyangiaceae bacterium]
MDERASPVLRSRSPLRTWDATPHVIIVGAGFGGISAARKLGSRPVRVTIYDRMNHHLFQPLLYQVALASLNGADIAVPIRSIVRRHANVSVVLGQVNSVDTSIRRVRLDDGSEDQYDYLILAAGAHNNYFGHEEWAGIAPGLKNLDDALEIRRRVLLAFEAAERTSSEEQRKRLLTFVVIGGGATGVELAGAIKDLSRDILSREFRHVRQKQTRVILLEMADRILMPFDPVLSAQAVRQLEGLGVEVRTNAHVTRIDEQGVWLGDELIAGATVLWGAGVRPSELGRNLGVPLDRSGRVQVLSDCSIPGHPEVFVIGDMASFAGEGGKPLPGVSPVAIQQGRSVASNILQELRGRPREDFHYRDKGLLATIGRARAVAQVGGLRLTGVLAWLTWALVHLWYLVGFRNRVAVFLSWIWSYVMSKHGARIIVGPRAITPKDIERVGGVRTPTEHQSPAPSS